MRRSSEAVLWICYGFAKRESALLKNPNTRSIRRIRPTFNMIEASPAFRQRWHSLKEHGYHPRESFCRVALTCVIRADHVAHFWRVKAANESYDIFVARRRRIIITKFDGEVEDIRSDCSRMQPSLCLGYVGDGTMRLASQSVANQV